MPAQPMHATSLLAGDRGILIIGPSGAGKTSLALALITHWRSAGLFASLVSDDQVVLAAVGGRLVASAPQTIAGLVEARSYGPAHIGFAGSAVMDLVVALVPASVAPRVHEDSRESIHGCTLPRLDLVEHDSQGAVRAVAACLSAWPFRPGGA